VRSRVVEGAFPTLDCTVVACAAAGSPVLWEAPHAGAPAFPHVHGPVPVRAVVAALGVSRDAAGELVLPDLAGLEVALDPPAL
jgi:uncharacterized protein (DUF952 family)